VIVNDLLRGKPSPSAATRRAGGQHHAGHRRPVRPGPQMGCPQATRFRPDAGQMGCADRPMSCCRSSASMCAIPWASRRLVHRPQNYVRNDYVSLGLTGMIPDLRAELLATDGVLARAYDPHVRAQCLPAAARIPVKMARRPTAWRSSGRGFGGRHAADGPRPLLPRRHRLIASALPPLTITPRLPRSASRSAWHSGAARRLDRAFQQPAQRPRGIKQFLVSHGGDICDCALDDRAARPAAASARRRQWSAACRCERELPGAATAGHHCPPGFPPIHTAAWPGFSDTSSEPASRPPPPSGTAHQGHRPPRILQRRCPPRSHPHGRRAARWRALLLQLRVMAISSQ
jgi:hypothetical protein